ncbi:formate-dependent phosphoribosylglycinamide formyltransferase [Mycobacterium sp. 050134]|uniref:formate-dependent phosphoribosylglycinamide formyltransferase n=1 Tax=Mycobacterium sp. 050134 TaxID=3096111 RepID=UPI002ED88B5C
MTDGPSEPQHELPADQPQPAAGGPRVMLLGGGGELSRELAIALRRLGATVIAAEERPGAPAHRVADEALVVPLTDGDELTRAVQHVHPHYVVTATRAVAVDALERLARGPAELVPNARSVRLTGDREGLRRLAADELGLPTAPFWFVGSADELEAVGSHAGYPLLVRPAAGPGRSVVAGPGDIPAAWQRAGTRRVLAETVVEVEFAVTLLLVRTEGPHGPVIDFCSPIGHDDGDAPESWQPQQMSAAAMDSARSIAARIVKALGGRGVFGVELMVNGDEVYFADVSARPRGSAWVTVRSQRLSAFELQARAILGLPADTMMISPGAARAIVAASGGPPPAAALAAALAVPETDLRLFGPSSGKLGVALATAPEVGAARDRARQAAAALNVPDFRG